MFTAQVILVQGQTTVIQNNERWKSCIKGVHLWALFLKTLCIFSKNKATSKVPMDLVRNVTR